MDASKYYNTIVNEVYQKPEDRAFLNKSRRMKVLFKYWGIKRVRNIEDAKATIPMCKYCGKELSMPRSTEPKDEEDEWIVTCRCPECVKKYTYDQTKRSLKKIYGVENISSNSGVRLKKSLIQRQNHLNRGQEITEKRRKTCLERYGVTNVSKIVSVQEKKRKILVSLTLAHVILSLIVILILSVTRIICVETLKVILLRFVIKHFSS